MVRSRLLRLIVAAWASTAAFALPMLPPEHVHVSHGSETHALVHRHDMVEHSHAGVVVDTGDRDHHDDHLIAQILEPVFRAASYVTVLRPFVTPEILSIVPDVRFVRAVVASDARLTHSPPPRSTPPRAPPTHLL